MIEFKMAPEEFKQFCFRKFGVTTIKEVAKIVGIEEKHFYRITNRNTKLTANVACKIALATNTKFDKLFKLVKED